MARKFILSICFLPHKIYLFIEEVLLNPVEFQLLIRAINETYISQTKGKEGSLREGSLLQLSIELCLEISVCAYSVTSVVSNSL